jgi:SAM-dependent methyltransferase
MTDVHIDGGDLLSQQAIRSVVRGIYDGVRPTDRRVAERFYSADELASLPDETVRIALGVGDPTRRARLRPGEDVVDLGSGGGIDCLLASRAVGPSGSVVGIDFLPAMIERATRAAAEAGLPNVRFEEGLMESVPLPDSSVDVVISNGVVNLSPRKVRVLAEAFRILRPGGRLAIVDLVLEHDLPAEIQTHPAAWAGCLYGALSEVALYKGLRRALPAVRRRPSLSPSVAGSARAARPDRDERLRSRPQAGARRGPRRPCPRVTQ